MSEQTNQTEAAAGQSLLTGVLGVAARLRHKTCGEISCDQCNDEREAAADSIDRMHEILAAIDVALKMGIPAAEVLDENSTIRDEIRDVLTHNLPAKGRAESASSD